MSWYGTHPTMSKSDARSRLPPGACKHCVYAMRVFGTPKSVTCPRCSGTRPAGDAPKMRAKLFENLYRRTFLHTEAYETEGGQVRKRWTDKVTIELTREEAAALNEALLFDRPIRKDSRE